MKGAAGTLRVLKFGGTCLADDRGRSMAVRHCMGELGDSTGLVVVVSAMGRMGDPYSTDTLLGLVDSPLPSEKAGLLACGEVIAASILADMLRGAGVRALAMAGWTAGLRTDGENCDRAVESVDPSRICSMLEENECVVIAGFQGLGSDGCVSTLGRGGSDVTAAALAAALEADELILYKTVDSVYTADPDKVPSAVRIERISSEDLRQMAWQGAEVVHPSAVEITSSAGMGIEIRDNATGDMVTSVETFTVSDGQYITGVAGGPEVAQFTVGSPEGEPLHSAHARIWGAVAEAGVSMDMFSVMGKRMMFTVPVADRDLVQEILGGIGVRGTSIHPCSKVSIVGAGMHGLEGVMARFASALDSAGIDMLQTVDSHATISALVRLEQRDPALRVLHREFIEK